MMAGGEGGLKHVVHRRVHKERAQPAARKRLGHLEKHKDYVKRAKDYHKKEDAIQKLHRKAYFKNEDEFSFGMLSRHQKNGRLRSKAEHLTEPELQLVDSQDARYIGMREQMDRKECERIKNRLHFLGSAKPKQHLLFVDEEDNAADATNGGVALSGAAPTRRRKLKDLGVLTHPGADPALLRRRLGGPLRALELEPGALNPSAAIELSHEARASYRELLQRQERLKRLTNVREELELRRHMRTKGRRTKVADAADGKPASFRWDAERKR